MNSALERRVAAGLVLVSLVVLVLLTGCSLPFTCQNNQPSGQGSAANDGTLSITVDHAVYAPGNTIGVTVTNLTSQKVYIAYQCQPVRIGLQNPCRPGEFAPGLQSIAFPPGVSSLRFSTSAPGKSGTYAATIQYVFAKDPALMAGNAKGSVVFPIGTELSSETFRVCDCGACS